MCFTPQAESCNLIRETPLALKTGLINISLKVSDDITNLRTCLGGKTHDFLPKAVTLMSSRIKYIIE